MLKVKKIPRTVHLSPELWQVIDERRAICVRGISQEVEFLIRKQLENEAKGDKLAVTMAADAAKDRVEQP